MATSIIVSYDGTANDDDGLALAKMLAGAGASLALAYVRHSREYDPQREEIAQHDAQRRLQQGAAWLGDESLPQHVVINPSTAEGLSRLAEAQGASAIVFGSDYRTTPGRLEPGAAAQGLLEGGTVAIAVAQAGLRTHPEGSIGSISVTPDTDDAAVATASALAAATGATVTALGDDTADLIVVGSQSTSPPGRIALSGATRLQLDSAHGSALVLPHGKPVLF